MQSQFFPSAVRKPQAIKVSKAKTISTPKSYPKAVRSNAVVHRRKNNVLLAAAVRLLAFTAKSVAKGLIEMIRFAFRLPGMAARSVKPQHTQLAK